MERLPHPSVDLELAHDNGSAILFQTKGDTEWKNQYSLKPRAYDLLHG